MIGLMNGSEFRQEQQQYWLRFFVVFQLFVIFQCPSRLMTWQSRPHPSESSSSSSSYPIIQHGTIKFSLYISSMPIGRYIFTLILKHRKWKCRGRREVLWWLSVQPLPRTCRVYYYFVDFYSDFQMFTIMAQWRHSNIQKWRHAK
jgi:hypothetical protein